MCIRNISPSVLTTWTKSSFTFYSEDTLLASCGVTMQSFFLKDYWVRQGVEGERMRQFFSFSFPQLTCVCVCGLEQIQQDLLCPCICSITQMCLSLCDPMDCSPPGSSVHGISQVRILEWVAISFFRGFSQPRNQQVDSLPPHHLGSQDLLPYTF